MNDTKMIRKTYSTKGNDMVVNGKFTEEQIEALNQLSGFTRVFWSEKVLWMNNGDVTSNGDKTLRTESGRHFTASKDNIMKGFGGREFIVTMLDEGGENEFRTTNLWDQGEIPREIRHILYPNATIKQADGYGGNF